LAVDNVKDEEEFIARVNNSNYSLIAGVFSSDEQKAQSIAERIQTSQVYINEFASWNGVVPLEGKKHSGKNSMFGLQGFQHFLRNKSYIYNFKA